MKRMIWPLLLLFAVFAQRAAAQCALDVTVSTPAPLSCTTTSVDVTATVTPNNGQLNYFWYGQGLTFPDTSTITITQPGTYVLAVTDSLNGCFGNYTFVISQDASFPVVTVGVTGAQCSGPNQGFILTAVANDPGVTYAWSDGSTAATTVCPGGQYCVTVTNQTGCSSIACINEPAYTPFTTSIWYSNPTFCGDSLGIFASPNGAQWHWPYTYLWNNGNTTSWNPPPVQAGYYAVTVTDALGCTATDSYYVEQDPNECGAIDGNVFADFNNDCLQNGADQGLHGFTVLIVNSNGDEIYAYTDGTGHYHASVEPGPYVVSVVLTNTNGLWTPCQASYLVDVPPSTSVTQDLPLQATALCPDLSVDISIYQLRRCNTNYYWVTYNNAGTDPATGAYIDVTLDPFLTLLDAGSPYTSLGGNAYRFDLGTVPFNSSGNFWIKTFLSCNATLGQTHCVEADIFPHDPCPGPPPNWSGAHVDLYGECNGSNLVFHAKNTGTAPMTTSLDYVIIEDAVMLMTSQGPPLGLGEDRVVFTAPANGATWRIETNQEPFNPGQSEPSLSVEGCANGQTFSTGFVNQFQTDDIDNWVDIDCRANIGSYDPNDKEGFPVGYGAEHYIKPGTPIEYLIRFQNTGTDVASTVVLRDTLSEWLDPASVVPGASSHPYRFDFYGNGNLRFVFDDINLPDSSANLEGSQGFVSFKVTPRADVPLETDIFNRAAIYFDKNEPVLTNTTQHRIGEGFLTLDTWNPAISGLDLLIAPNPAFDYALLQLHGIESGAQWQVELLDATGRKVRSEKVSGPEWRLERGNLPAGLYLLRASENGRLLGTGKLIVK